jgi:hypothetical protein
MTNYGLTIAYSLGIFERALEPFPAALEVYRKARGEGMNSSRALARGEPVNGRSSMS